MAERVNRELPRVESVPGQLELPLACVCADCLSCEPLNPAEEDRAAERAPADA